MILPKYGAAIFINGCFWHCHDCHLFKWPQTRKEFWENKIISNKARDGIDRISLLQVVWRILIVWECALKGKTKLDRVRLIDEIEAWIVSDSDYVNICGHNIGIK